MTRLLFHSGRLFDGTGSPAGEADVVVADGRFLAVGSDLDGDEAVDCSGRTILPGLFDCHVHVTMSGPDLLVNLNKPFSYPYFEAVVNLRRTLAAGITTVRDAGGADLGVKEAVDNGLVPGPRLKIAIAMLSQTGGHADRWMACGLDLTGPATPGAPWPIVDGVDSARRKVRELIRAGADHIKVCTSGGVLSPRDDPRHAHFRPDELEEIVAEALVAHTYVMAHAQATDGIKNAVRAGIRSIEHGVFLDDEAIEMMLASGTWLVPTLSAPLAVLEAADRSASLPPQMVAKARDVIAAHRDSIARAVAAGVKIAMGTDSGVGPHGENLRELDLMQQAGMAPNDVLAATSFEAARLLQVSDKLGTIEVGKRADLVVVAGDPLDFSTLADRVEQVWKDGVRAAWSGASGASA